MWKKVLSSLFFHPIKIIFLFFSRTDKYDESEGEDEEEVDDEGDEVEGPDPLPLHQQEARDHRVLQQSSVILGYGIYTILGDPRIRYIYNPR